MQVLFMPMFYVCYTFCSNQVFENKRKEHIELKEQEIRPHEAHIREACVLFAFYTFYSRAHVILYIYISIENNNNNKGLRDMSTMLT